MPRTQVEHEEDRTVPEDTPVKAVVAEVTDRVIRWTDRQTGEAKEALVWDWWFKVTDKAADGGKYEGRKVKGQTDAKITNHDRNKARMWCEAVMGRELPVGVGVDTDEDIVNLPCVLTVSHREYENKDGEKRVAEEVSEVFPIDGFDDVPFS